MPRFGRHTSTRATSTAVAGEVLVRVDQPPVFSSTIIATIGRPTLSRAVGSVLGQTSDAEFEVIVVNDSGRPLAGFDWCRKTNGDSFTGIAVRLLDALRSQRLTNRPNIVQLPLSFPVPRLLNSSPDRPDSSGLRRPVSAQLPPGSRP